MDFKNDGLNDENLELISIVNLKESELKKMSGALEASNSKLKMITKHLDDMKKSKMFYKEAFEKLELTVGQM